MTAGLRKLLVHAAKLLADEAEIARRSCSGVARDWACADCRQPCAARRVADDQVRTSSALRKAVRRG